MDKVRIGIVGFETSVIAYGISEQREVSGASVTAIYINQKG